MRLLVGGVDIYVYNINMRPLAMVFNSLARSSAVVA